MRTTFNSRSSIYNDDFSPKQLSSTSTKSNPKSKVKVKGATQSDPRPPIRLLDTTDLDAWNPQGPVFAPTKSSGRWTRLNTPRACDGCRSRHVACAIVQSGIPCPSCIKRGTTCELFGQKRKATAPVVPFYRTILPPPSAPPASPTASEFEVYKPDLSGLESAIGDSPPRPPALPWNDGPFQVGRKSKKSKGVQNRFKGLFGSEQPDIVKDSNVFGFDAESGKATNAKDLFPFEFEPAKRKHPKLPSAKPLPLPKKRCHSVFGSRKRRHRSPSSRYLPIPSRKGQSRSLSVGSDVSLSSFDALSPRLDRYPAGTERAVSPLTIPTRFNGTTSQERSLQSVSEPASPEPQSKDLSSRHAIKRVGARHAYGFESAPRLGPIRMLSVDSFTQFQTEAVLAQNASTMRRVKSVSDMNAVANSPARLPPIAEIFNMPDGSDSLAAQISQSARKRSRICRDAEHRGGAPHVPVGRHLTASLSNPTMTAASKISTFQAIARMAPTEAYLTYSAAHSSSNQHENDSQQLSDFRPSKKRAKFFNALTPPQSFIALPKMHGTIQHIPQSHSSTLEGI